MSDDSADELILKMKHLEAQAKAGRQADVLSKSAGKLKNAAQKLAASAQAEVTRLEKQQDDAEKALDAIRVDGVQSAEAPAFLEARNKGEEAKKGLVRARAQLNFALDQLSEVDRREYEAFQAEVRAEHHGVMSDDPMFNKG